MRALFRRLARLVLPLLIVAAAPHLLLAQDLEIPSRREVAIPNETFHDVVTRGKITQHFEMYNPRSREQLQTLKEMGFTQVILDWPDLHRDASELGLDVVMANWWSLKTSWEQIEKSVELAKQVDPARLVAVSMMDEPERYARDTPFIHYRRLYESLRSHFDETMPEVKLEISHWGPLLSWTDEFYEAFVPLYQATDRIRLMPYPDLDEGPLDEVYYQMLRSRRLMDRADRFIPQVVILQTWVIPDAPKLPTIEELRVMAYTAMLGGADTLSFFNYDTAAWDKTPGFAAGFSKLMGELTSFADRYAAAEFETRLDQDGLLHSTIYGPNLSPVRVVVNTRRSATGQLPGLAVVIDDPALSYRSCTPQRPTRPGLRRWRWRRLRCR